MRLRQNRSGIILIFALWVLGILTILAVSVAAGIRQKIFLVAHLDERNRMNYLMEAAIKKTAGYIHQEMEESSFAFTPMVKMNLLNNAAELSSINLGRDQAGVGYVALDSTDTALRWGIVDEESKLNLNKTNILSLATLLVNVLGLKDEEAAKLALSLLDWRQYGEGTPTGFFSDDYYSNQQNPYPKKNAPYETLDEMLLVKGMNKKMYDKLIDYVTIYGDGGININTASKEVLEALGLQDALIDKVISVRRGKDGVEGTEDDHVFVQMYDIAAEVNAATPLQFVEAQAIDNLNNRGLLTSSSYYYTISATGRLAGHSNSKSVRAVYSSREDKIVYWKER